MSPLAAWANFYVIAGTAAATLTGLMFVVLTLIVNATRRRSNAGLGVYSTPTVVHFGAALLVTVLLSAPWPDLWEASIPLGCLGLAGLAYGVVVLRRATIAARSETYRPVLEDWLCHAILPPIAYAVLLVAAFVLPRHPTPALFAVGAVVILIHPPRHPQRLGHRDLHHRRAWASRGGAQQGVAPNIAAVPSPGPANSTRPPDRQPRPRTRNPPIGKG